MTVLMYYINKNECVTDNFIMSARLLILNCSFNFTEFFWEGGLMTEAPPDSFYLI